MLKAPCERPSGNLGSQLLKKGIQPFGKTAARLFASFSYQIPTTSVGQQARPTTIEAGVHRLVAESHPPRRAACWRAHCRRIQVFEDGPRTGRHQLLGLLFAEPFGRRCTPFRKIGRPTPGSMRVGRQNLHERLVQHSLGPIPGPPSKGAGQRSGSNLHPDASAEELNELRVMGLDPSSASPDG